MYPTYLASKWTLPFKALPRSQSFIFNVLCTLPPPTSDIYPSRSLTGCRRRAPSTGSPPPDAHQKVHQSLKIAGGQDFQHRLVATTLKPLTFLTDI